jgi:diacylglycerol kinase family enzyme
MDLHIDKWQQSIDIIKNRKTRKVDIGVFSTEGKNYYFLNIIGLGFVADVGATAHKLKLFGNFSYTLGVIYQTLFLKPTKTFIETEDDKIELDTLFVEVSNSKYTANFLMAPNAELDDGMFDITVAKPMSRIKLLKSFPKILTGDHIKMEEVLHFKAKDIQISTAKKKILTPDGELMGSTPVKIDCIKEAVDIFWP